MASPRMSLVDSMRLSMSKDMNVLAGDNKAASDDVVERILKATDPNIMSIPVYFDYRKESRTYRLFPSVGGATTHLTIDGSSLRRDCPEAVAQEEDRNRRMREVEAAAAAELNPDLVDSGLSTSILKNQFNYSDRGSQTMNAAVKQRSVVTDPPPAVTFGSMASAWEIFDAYEADRLQTEKITAAQKKAAAAHRAGNADDTAIVAAANAATIRDEQSVGPRLADDILSSSNFFSALNIMERMVNQNDGFDIIDDFKYWEDQSDLYKEEGTLLPLWQFFTEKTKKRAVTSLSMSSRYDDFFAVAYGSYEFQKPTKGTIHCFTLKNAVPSIGGTSQPAHPEFSYYTESGVLCLAFHPTETYLLACGLYDGSVCVFDLRIKAEKRNRPLYRASVRNGKHTDPVWQLYWKPSSKELSFNSISTDGRITNWTISKKEMTSKDMMTLNTGVCTSDPEKLVLSQLGGMCIDYSAVHDRIVVGTQEGALMLCTTSYHGQCLERYDGHSMSVYAARWNSFHPDIFITCSADWTVKLWLQSSTTPLLTFDLGDCVGDVAWAPYSSTVFAAVTASGRVAVFDLNQNKTEPLCVQTVVKNAQLTHVVFNKVEPVILVGDSRGSVLTLKLSPNLRKIMKPGKGEPDDAAALLQLEKDKVSRLIDITLKDRALLGAE